MLEPCACATIYNENEKTLEEHKHPINLGSWGEPGEDIREVQGTWLNTLVILLTLTYCLIC